MKAPFPWFGGKSRIADLVWSYFGNTPNYVEPFAGSLAVLLDRPHAPRHETVNDIDCYLANFWRSIAHDPEEVAHHADWPINEADLHSRHVWLVNQVEFRERMKTDPDHFDAKVAGWWVWGICAWIGDGWCDPNRGSETWHVRPSLSSNQGVHRQLPIMHPTGVHRPARKRPIIHKGGVGVHSAGAIDRPVTIPKRPTPEIMRNRGIFSNEISVSLLQYIEELHNRLRRVRVCCGDWKRVCQPTPTFHVGLTAVFLDPPYGVDDRDEVYNNDDFDVASDVREWCAENGSHAKLRIALCGYEGEHNDLEGMGWKKLAWNAPGGYGASRSSEYSNGRRERVWFSPNCLDPELQMELDFG